MINLDIQWGEPYQMSDDKGMWRREWLIPTEYRNPFFVYWKTNSFKLKDKGYSVSKRDNDWYLIETQTTKDQFSKSKANKKELISEDVVLKPHTMKHSDGSLIASYVKNRKTHKEEFKWKIPKSTLIVWDESQKLKGANTKNSEVCLLALKEKYKMLFCSATNATNPLELKTVGMAIKLFENNKQYYQWLYAHGVSKGRFGLQFNNNKDVLKKLHKDIFVNRGSRLTRDTIPNFPESQIIAECYDMEEEAQNKINSIYDEMEAELAKLKKKIKKEKLDSASELTAILRARQKVELVKVPLFVEMVEEALENNMSVVLFLNFTETIDALSKRLGTKCIVNGVVSDVDRQNSIDAFQADKERVILVKL